LYYFLFITILYIIFDQRNSVNRQYALLFDAGCGPGLMSTVFLAPYFDKVLGVENLLVPDRAGNSQQQTK